MLISQHRPRREQFNRTIRRFIGGAVVFWVVAGDREDGVGGGAGGGFGWDQDGDHLCDIHRDTDFSRQILVEAFQRLRDVRVAELVWRGAQSVVLYRRVVAHDGVEYFAAGGDDTCFRPRGRFPARLRTTDEDQDHRHHTRRRRRDNSDRSAKGFVLVADDARRHFHRHKLPRVRHLRRDFERSDNAERHFSFDDVGVYLREPRHGAARCLVAVVDRHRKRPDGHLVDDIVDRRRRDRCPILTECVCTVESRSVDGRGVRLPATADRILARRAFPRRKHHVDIHRGIAVDICRSIFGYKKVHNQCNLRLQFA